MTRPIPSTVSNNKSNNSTRRSASSNAIANWRKKPLTQNPKTRRKSVSARRAFPSAPPMATSRSICEASCNWTREHFLKTAGSRAMMVSCCAGPDPSLKALFSGTSISCLFRTSAAAHHRFLMRTLTIAIVGVFRRSSESSSPRLGLSSSKPTQICNLTSVQWRLTWCRTATSACSFTAICLTAR